MRILLVEDAPFLRYAFGRLLRLHGFDVMEAENGHEALEGVLEFRPHLVVTDLMMSGIDGIELISRLRADAQTAHLPVLAITADSNEQMETRARRAGAADFLTKPIDLSTLLDHVRAFCPAG
jgi:CheY-like chemotaxis protein